MSKFLTLMSITIAMAAYSYMVGYFGGKGVLAAIKEAKRQEAK